mgnify:CR=1 FL=1
MILVTGVDTPKIRFIFCGKPDQVIRHHFHTTMEIRCLAFIHQFTRKEGIIHDTPPFPSAIGPFFAILDARRSDGVASTAALAALPGALNAYAPGLVGFGLIALLTRALWTSG